jgi:hypothetical protein
VAEYAEERAATLQDDVDGSAHTVCSQQVRCPKTLLALEIVRNHQLARAQRIPDGDSSLKGWP